MVRVLETKTIPWIEGERGATSDPWCFDLPLDLMGEVSLDGEAPWICERFW
jgi:hypothetical protein